MIDDNNISQSTQQENEQFDFLDIINILSFSAQLENMYQDTQTNKKISKIMLGIFKEIQKLHKENDLIVEQLNRIESKLNNLIL